MKGLRRLILEELRSVSELVKPEEINLSSFAMRQNLNPKIWKSDDKINSPVRKKLLKIADDFVEFLDIPWVEIKDVTLTGSLANYNWSKYSDIDLHVIINFEDIGENEVLVKDYLDSKRKIWNDSHEITIHGFEVEIYCQDENEVHHSTGVYSLEDNKWVVQPNRNEPDLNRDMIKRKASELMTKMDEIIEISKDGNHNEVLNQYEKLWDKIKKMRKTGLEREGEFSYENLVFKVLRRSGYIEKFLEIKTNAYDKLHSI
jgi:hypothetical protein